MEVETMVIDDDGQPMSTVVTRRQSSKKRKTRKVNLIRVGIGCMLIALIAVLVAVGILKSAPAISESRKMVVTKEGLGTQEIVLKAMFTTNYVPDNDNQSLKITNTDDIANQLSKSLNGNKIYVINAFFPSHLFSKGYNSIICEKPLSGNILQLNIATYYSRQCPSQNENLCKTEFQKQLKDIFLQILTIPITIQFDDDRYKNINIQLCRLKEMTEEELDARRRRGMKKTTTSIPLPIKPASYIPTDSIVPSVSLKKSRCSLDIGKIASIQMTGEHDSYIQDNIRTNTISNNDQNQQYITVSVYEGTTYQLYVQFNCNSKQFNRGSRENVCNPSQKIIVWIDFNDNDFDDGESRVFPNSVSNDRISGGTYNLEINIPYTDGRNTRAGRHRMRITATPSEEYQRVCGTVDYQEIRDYTINIIPKATYPVNPPPPNIIYNNPPPSNLIYSSTRCSLKTPKIILVLMAGERGTQIRDDIGTNLLPTGYENQHHMIVNMHEHTVYLLRIQLDCSWQLDTELFQNGCNLAQDVKVWVDLNNDGQFDESEIGAPYRWPVTSYLPQGVYDIQITIPQIDGRYTRTGQHRMRIVALASEHYLRTCGRNDHSETREYMVNIIPKTGYSPEFDITTPYMELSNLVCPRQLGKIILAVMAGEHRTQIRDDSVTRDTSRYNNHYQQHLSIILYENTVYLLRIQLDCSGQWNGDALERNCNLAHDVNVWIDLNDDGIYDNSENAAPFRWPINSYTPQGVYDLQIYVPIIHTKTTKTGPYRMRLVVMLSEPYRRKCKDNGYKETRDYNVTIVPNTRQPVDIKHPYVALSDNVCSLNNGKIVLVLMAGEQGTQIRDNILTDTLLSENQNRHHLAVSLYENTIYRIRVQLDCYHGSTRGLSDSNCNLAKDVDVWIDLNNDGKYDNVESRISHRWPLYSSMPLGIYDFEIHIPTIHEQHIRSGQHRLGIVVKPSDEYVRKCGNKDYSETREYTVNIIPKAVIHREAEYRYVYDPTVPPLPEAEYRYVYGPTVPPLPDFRDRYCSPGNLVCLNDNNAVSLVELSGEQDTEIQDEMKICSSTNNYNDRSNLIVTLFDNTAYTLRIELYCSQQSGYGDSSLYQRNCDPAYYPTIWIDFNSDGIFDDSRERVHSQNWNEDGNRAAGYSINIVIPPVDGRSYLDGHHRMRIVLTSDERNRKPCQNTGYGEVRDYTVRIMRTPVQ